MSVRTRSGYLSELEDSTAQQSLAIYVLLGVVVAFCALAAVNALMMATAERGREFALLRLTGATARQIMRMTRAETLVVTCFGLAVGSLISASAVAVFAYGLTGSADPAVPVWLYAGPLAACVLVALAASFVSTRLALRADPVTAIGARE